MKRITKNVLMLLLLVITISCMVFTVYYAKNHLTGSSQVQSSSQTGGMSTPPEKPSGDSNSSATMSDPPEKPSGDSSSTATMSEPPEMPGNSSTGSETTTSTLSTTYYAVFGVESFIVSLVFMYLVLSGFNKLSFKDTFKSADKVIIYILTIVILVVLLTLGMVYIYSKVSKITTSTTDNNTSQNSTASYTGVKEITSDATIDGESYTSSTSDENAVLVNGKITTVLSNINVSKTGDSDGGDNTSFYGINSAIIAKSGANLTISNATISTSATGANGVFSYGGSATTSSATGDGTTVNISDSTITTSADNSGGIMTTGGGVMNATNLVINTSGTSSAAIRSDRGGGTVSVDGGTYTTSGKGSPSIYSTANISVKNATLVAKTSEGVVIEGKNSIVLNGCTLTDDNNTLNGQSTTYKNIFLYQSMSGDADTGTASFTSKNSTINTKKGDTIYVTNTTASISLEGNKITNSDSTGNFLRIQKDSWGTSGSNGGSVTLTMSDEDINGNIVVDSISSLGMTMTGSKYEGIINGDNTAKKLSLTLDSSSSIKLTGNSYVTSLSDADSSYSNIDFNGYKLYVNGTSIN